MSKTKSVVNEPSPFVNTPLVFNGENVTRFIKEIERRGKFYQWSIGEQIERLLDHCDPAQRDIIEASMSDFEEARKDKDWPEIKVVLRKRFKAQDELQQEETEDSLRLWCQACSVTPNLSLQHYLDSFGPRFNRCLEAGSVAIEYKGYYLAKGLNKQRLSKVLNKFDLLTTSPLEFQYDKIETFLNKLSSREAELENFNPAFSKKEQSRMLPVELGPNVPLGPAVAFQAPRLDPSRVIPNSIGSQATRPRGDRGVQMPPGYKPTQGEVDDLIEKFSNIKINGMNAMLIPQHPREAELLSNAEVRRDVETALQRVGSVPARPIHSNHTQQLGPALAQPTGPMNRYAAPTQPSQQYNAQAPLNSNVQAYDTRPPLQCYACQGLGHTANQCSMKAALVNNRWAHIGERGRLFWGTAERPDGEVRAQGQPVVQAMVEGIKNQLRKNGHPVVDPLTTMNPYEPKAQSPIGVASNTIIMEDPTEAAGIMEDDAFRRALRQADLDDVADGGIFQVSSVGCANPTRSACEAVTNAALNGSSGRSPVVRNNKSRDADWHLPKAVSFSDDVTMEDQPTQDKTNKETSKKLRLLESLTTDPNEMVSQVLRAPISVSLQDLLAIAPELQKRIGKPFYQAEDLSKITKPSKNTGAQGYTNLQVNALAVSCPEYFHVTAKHGRITGAGSRSACPNGSLELLPALQGQTTHKSFSMATTSGVDEDAERSTMERREYDREHGFEHVRRDCPRAPTTINGARLSALLDSGAELNTIRLKTAQAAGLVITSMPAEMASSRMQAANGSFETFAGMVWRAPIAIGNITIPTNLFVLKSLSSPLILGNPYLADAQCTFQYKADGKMRCTIYSEDRSSNASFIGATDNTLGTIARASIQPKEFGV